MHFIKTKLIFIIIMAFFPAIGFAAINVDGRLDETEWVDAQTFRDFVVIDPLTLDTPRFPTEARLLSLPEGIAVAFICEQPSAETRTRTITPLDTDSFDADSVTLMIDFDGTGKIAYEFSISITNSYRDGIVTSENMMSYEWDGVWQHAVAEEPERWTVEVLIPWSIAAMREGSGDTSLMGIFFQRQMHERNEKFAFPDASTERARFVSDFAKIEIKSYTAHEFIFVPYVTVLSDLLNDRTTGKTGMDLFWRSGGKFQVAATINPDFGQVESDDLVINFSASETQYGEKRPFFTENQGIFNTFLPNGSIFYTRRIGGPNDNDGGASDIDGALKIIGSTDAINYGFFAAQEAEDIGRSFYAGRVVFPSGKWSLGATTTYTERPFLERTALVNSIDYTLNLGKSFMMRGQFFGSNIDADAGDSNGSGSFNDILYSIDDRWFYEASLLYFNDTLDLNDMGYNQRKSLIEPLLRVEYQQTDFSENSRAASVSWSWSTLIDKNTEGDRLPSSIMLSRREKMKSGAEMDIRIGLNTSGYDDLSSRGNGLFWLNKRWENSISYSTPRRDAWRKSLTLNLFQEGYEGWAAGLEGNVTWYPQEKFNLDFSLKPEWSRDWLIWIQGNQLGTFSRHQVTGEINANWFPAERHEIRLRSQWITINADAMQSYRIGDNSRLARSNDPLNSFAKINFALQLRYRYEIAPLSYLYLVYSRGGLEDIESPSRSTLGLIGESMGIRKSDQIMMKLSYRF